MSHLSFFSLLMFSSAHARFEPIANGFCVALRNGNIPAMKDAAVATAWLVVEIVLLHFVVRVLEMAVCFFFYCFFFTWSID